MDEIVRDGRGRFVKGHSGNPRGRPIDQYKYLRKMGAAVSAREWREIIRKAVEQAKRGDPRAREWLAHYLMGKPLQTVDITSDGSALGAPLALDKATDEQLHRLEDILTQLSEPADGRAV